MIEILKASAGSGKTYSLARKYIELLLNEEDNYAYRHILAVTFTNKATDEMKSRILKELYVLASTPDQSGYRDYMMSYCGFETVADMSHKAERVLNNILHDYSAFAISTIDRFFQRTLKAFSREIGQFASYQVELDRDSLINESVARILDSLTEKDQVLLSWLTDNSLERIESGKGYNLEDILGTVAKRLKSEEHRVKVEETGVDEEKMYSQEALALLKKTCKEIIANFHEDVARRANAVAEVFDTAAVPVEETNRSFLKFIRGYQNPSEFSAYKPVTAPTKAFITKALDPDQWFSKAKKVKYFSLVHPFAEAPLEDFVAVFDEPFKIYNTAIILLQQIFGFGVAASLYKEFDLILKEKNVLSLDDSNTILKGIIDGTETPFIYEKLGVRYSHFLLDEFQDTAHVQWDNFRPLLQESLANGEYNLIVGDVKQSIYRWRNSDWDLLDSGVEAAFSPDEVSSDTLQNNYRSASNIVEFNNSFFKIVAPVLDNLLTVRAGTTVKDDAGISTSEKGAGQKAYQKKSISEIYADVKQNVATNQTSKGSIEVTLCDDDVDQEQYVVEAVNRAHESGWSYRDMAVLVRGNSEGGSIASALVAKGISVVTDDSLKVKSSVIVRRLVALLSAMDNPDNAIATYLVAQLGICLPDSYHSLVDLCEYFIRVLNEHSKADLDREVLYIQSFMDILRDFVSREGNNLHGFLEYWEEDDSSISSPSDSDSVRIMTIHKSKGLDFPYVILPFVDKVNLFKANTDCWCKPDVAGTQLENVADGIYDVKLSSNTADTLFVEDYRRELKLQMIDNLNIMYVAMTRAATAMHFILPSPTKSFLNSLVKSSSCSQLQSIIDNLESNSESMSDVEKAKAISVSIKDLQLPDFSNFGQILYWYLLSLFANPQSYNIIGDLNRPASKEASKSTQEVIARYDSFPLNPSDATKHVETNLVKDDAQEGGNPDVGHGENQDEEHRGNQAGDPDDIRLSGRLKFSTSSIDFFADDGSVGFDASPRLRGILLHDILSLVKVPADLPEAVKTYVANGELPEDEADGVLRHLQNSISQVMEKGWFPDDPKQVLNETSIIDTDGEIYRPDRVVLLPDNSVIVIDYKFGAHRRRYEDQIAHYADLYRRMGYTNVTTALWYVDSGRIVEK